jgi:pimeloyl-ACP methyl ester carboxylesterase
MNSEFVQAGPVRLQYFEAGSGDTTLLLVHGYRSSARVWSFFQEALDPSLFRSIAIGNRGAGDSDRTPSIDDYSVESFSRDLRAAVDALGLKQFVLIGHSMGGATVTRFALDHPELLRALVLLDPAPLGGRPLADGWQAQVEASWRAGTMEPESLSAQTPASYKEALRADVLRNPLERLLGGRKSMSAIRLREHLPDLLMPVLVIGGDQDTTVGVDNILTEYLTLRPEVRSLHVFHGIGHSPNSECPAEMAALVERYVGALEPVASVA